MNQAEERLACLKTGPNQLPDRKRVPLLRHNRVRIEVQVLTGPKEPKTDPIKTGPLANLIELIRTVPGKER